MSLTLSDLKPGDRARIKRFSGATPAAYRQRLLTMGLLPHTEIQLIRRAPFGDPVQIAVRGTLLSLRQPEAVCIELERVS